MATPNSGFVLMVLNTAISGIYYIIEVSEIQKSIFSKQKLKWLFYMQL